MSATCHLPPATCRLVRRLHPIPRYERQGTNVPVRRRLTPSVQRLSPHIQREMRGYEDRTRTPPPFIAGTGADVDAPHPRRAAGPPSRTSGAFPDTQILPGRTERGAPMAGNPQSRSAQVPQWRRPGEDWPRRMGVLGTHVCPYPGCPRTPAAVGVARRVRASVPRPRSPVAAARSADPQYFVCIQTLDKSTHRRLQLGRHKVLPYQASDIHIQPVRVAAGEPRARHVPAGRGRSAFGRRPLRGSVCSLRWQAEAPGALLPRTHGQLCEREPSRARGRGVRSRLCGRCARSGRRARGRGC